MSLIDTLKKYILFILLAIIAGSFLAGYSWVWPKYQEYQIVKNEFDLADDEIKAKEEYLPKLEDISRVLEEDSGKINIIESAFPLDPSIASLYEYFKKTISENGLIAKHINIVDLFNKREEDAPKEDISANVSKDVGEMLFSVSVIGSYESFKLFLAEIYLSSRMIEVVSIGLSSELEGLETLKLVNDNFVFDLDLKTQAYKKPQEAIVNNSIIDINERGVIDEPSI